MSAQPWPQPADPRRTVRVGRARVRVAEQAGSPAAPSALIWQQRLEDALRCAHFGTGQRLVLLRKLQVKACSAAGVMSPGWAGVVEAAAQDAVARACNGRSAGAEQAGAVWFESWDDAVAAWLDAVLGWPGQRVSPQAWFWSRIARMAGLPTPAASLASSASLSRAPLAISSQAIEQARAMLVCWQADPASQRACSEWFAQRPALRALLLPVETASAVGAQAGVDAKRSEDVEVASKTETVRADDGGDVRPSDSLSDAVSSAHAQAPSLDVQPAGEGRRMDAVVEARKQTDVAQALEQARPFGAPEAPTHTAEHDASLQARRAVVDANSPIAAQPSTASAAARSAQPILADEVRSIPNEAEQVPAWSNQVASAVEPAAPTISALGWTQLRSTQLGGLPLTLNALQRLGFADALDAVSSSLDQVDRLVAASAPWLAVWAGLAPAACQRWVRDPMFAVLPAFDLIADLPVQERAGVLLARWQAQPPAVRHLGRRMWRRLQGATQTSGWRSPRLLLQRAAWMQLSATHLDVIFSFDQVDLSVRRLGLDADPGWVPWLGRIVNLHFEPANELPPHLPHRSTP
jgi:hypothetical protein